MPKIAHPVNHLSHKKWAPQILKLGHLELSFAKLTNRNRETPLEQPQNRQIPQCCPEICRYLILLDNINTLQNCCSWNPTLCISRWWHWKGDTSQSFRGKTHYIWVRTLKHWMLPTQLIIFPHFGAKILKIAHPVNYSYLPPCHELVSTRLWKSTWVTWICTMVMWVHTNSWKT